jgi:ABC-type antimicrobial peptide transport system permease subunit
MYFPIAQRPDQRFTVVARTTADPATLAPPVRQVVRALDASLPLDQISTLEEHIGLSLLPARLAGMVLGLLGMLALVLASLGVAGMVAFGVSQRVREIGLRLALGAQSSDVVRLVVRDALRLVLIGGGVGLALALPLSLLARRFLYGLSPVDPMTWVVVVLGFVAVTAGASWLPARRAAGVDPLVALRAD